MPGSQTQKGQKVGQEYGDIRAPLPLDRLVPYLEANVDGWQGPLEIQQFKVSILYRSLVFCFANTHVVIVRTGEL